MRFLEMSKCQMARMIIVLVQLLLLENVAHGSHQRCILGTAEPGICIRSEKCAEIVGFIKRDTIYPAEVQRLRAAVHACGGDENETDPIVCCGSPPPASVGNRRNIATSTTTTTTTTTTIAPTRRATPRPVTTQLFPTRRLIPTPIPSFTTTSTSIPYNPIKNVLPAKCGWLPPFSLAWGAVEDDQNIHAWAVYLEIQRSSQTGRCVGTLIHERFVLTAAHCVHTARPENIKMYFGLVLYSERQLCLDDGLCQERWAEELIVHPNYNSHSELNDVALIRIGTAVNFTDDIRPACLALDHLFDENVESDTRIISVGWGKYEGGRMSDSKRVVQLKVIGKDQCKEQLRKWPRFNISMVYSVMCTMGVQKGQDVCEGDSGAPMLQYLDNRYYVLGLASFGPKCGMNSAKAGVWMRLSEYTNWILTNLKRNEYN